jgi:membrane-bound lytic murein transglycosylase D
MERPSQETAAAKEVAEYYTIKKGDTLVSLAKKFKVSARILSAWNNLKGKVALRPGKRIIVARYAPKVAAPATEEKS